MLVAEDNLVNQRLIVRLLERDGHRVTLVSNGREAVDAVLREEFDVILFDTPPAKLYADAQSVAFRAGSVMLLARKDHTRVADTTSVMRELGDTGVHIVGTVFNAF